MRVLAYCRKLVGVMATADGKEIGISQQSSLSANAYNIEAHLRVFYVNVLLHNADYQITPAVLVTGERERERERERVFAHVLSHLTVVPASGLSPKSLRVNDVSIDFG
jgi:hypothetical protein